jgi:hypothetical protein
MPDSPEARARKNIDQLLPAAGWVVQSRDEVNSAAGHGIAIREFPMKPGFGEADYLLYVDGQALGVVEAKKRAALSPGLRGGPQNIARGLLTLCLPPGARCHSAIRAPGSKPASQTFWNQTLPAAMSFLSSARGAGGLAKRRTC